MHVHAQVRVVVGAVVDHVPLDVLALVTESDHEVAEPVPEVVAHDVPEDRLPTDLDHGLRPNLGLLRQSSPESPGEDTDLHGLTPCPLDRLTRWSLSLFSARDGRPSKRPRASSHTNVQFPTRYRRQRRLGSPASRNTHSRPTCRRTVGAA